MQLLYGPLCFSRRGHFHLAHAERLSGRVYHDQRGKNGTEGSEQILQLLGGERGWQPLKK